MSLNIFFFLIFGIIFLPFPILAQNRLASSSTPIQIGWKTGQVIAAKGQPYYQTEHYSNRSGEEVWLYTKSQIQKTVDEKKMVDTKTNWPTLHRKTIVRTCEVGDIFVQVSQGVVASIIPANPSMTYGPCVIETTEEFLPIVDGKVANVATHKVIHTSLEGAKKSK